MDRDTSLPMEVAKAAPAVAGSIASALTLNEWIMVGTGMYLLLQMLYLLRKWWREEAIHAERKRHKRRRETDPFEAGTDYGNP